MNGLIDKIFSEGTLQGILAIAVVVGCFLSYFQFQTVPDWAIQLVMLVFGFFFGSRLGRSLTVREVVKELDDERRKSY